MNQLNQKLKILSYITCSFIFVLIIANNLYSQEVDFEIRGNKFTDTAVILSLLNDIPEDLSEENSDKILKILNDSNLFSKVSVKYLDNKYIIILKEYPNINKIYFRDNNRLKDDELYSIVSQVNLNNFNLLSINLFIKETQKIYESFGYNNIEISFYEKYYEETNNVDLFFSFNEGKITKIKNIFIKGNKSILSQELKAIINSKTKSIINLFANNNFKPTVVERDNFIIINYYKNNGFLDVKVESEIEYLETNKVNIYFNIIEGTIYNLSSINIINTDQILDKITLKYINNKIDELISEDNIFSFEKIKNLKNEISSMIVDSGIEFFEINSFEKVNQNTIDIAFQIVSVSPKYTKQINIAGNSRTYDYVIRRELGIVEGDAIYDNQIQNIRDKLKSLNLFESVSVKEEENDDNTINLIIEVEEKQTGNFNAGVSVGTLDGFSIVTGLRERNFYGTGRSLEVLLNTSEDRNQFKLVTTDRLSYDNDADVSYKTNYKQEDFSKASSYKLDTFSAGLGIGYRLNTNLYHNIDFEYVLKDYKITNAVTASSSIIDSSGGNMSFLIKNNFRYSTINPGFIPRNGRMLNYNNSIETPTSSRNGFVRNIITFKNYYSIDTNILSIQTKLGNIVSLNNKDILTDDKFSLGGRWLRGFDSYGAGPRNSRTSYVGGNNVAVAKLDYSYEITRDSDFPIYFNIFNDYGLIWENKTKPTQTNNTIRSSAGFGIKYYSPIGPIGFTWGFPINHEDYDIKRMFLFSVGNIDWN